MGHLYAHCMTTSRLGSPGIVGVSLYDLECHQGLVNSADLEHSKHCLDELEPDHDLDNLLQDIDKVSDSDDSYSQSNDSDNFENSDEDSIDASNYISSDLDEDV